MSNVDLHSIGSIDTSLEEQPDELEISSDQDSAEVLSAQAEALGILEIVELIVSFLGTPIPIPNAPDQRDLNVVNRRDLRNTALASKIFFDPAMDILWRSINSWKIILKLLGSLCYMRSGGICDHLYTTTGNILDTEVARMLSYTRRIQRLSFQSFNKVVSPHIYASIRLFAGNFLLPSLKRLVIQEFNRVQNDDLNSLFLTPNPSLESLCIRNISFRTEVAASSLIFCISNEARSILRIELTGQFGNIILKQLPTLGNLKSIRLVFQTTLLDIDFIQKLSEFVNLTRLTLYMENQTSIVPKLQKIFRFGNLQALTLKGPASSILSVLQSIRFVRLDWLRLELMSPTTGGVAATAVEDCLNRLSLNDTFQTLKSIEVEGSQIKFGDLEFLRPCSNTEHLVAKIDYLTDARIERFLDLGCWKNLQTLKLECDHEESAGNGLWIYDVVLISQNCRNLTVLSISLSRIVRQQEDVQTLELCLSNDTLFQGHRLKELNILPIASRPSDFSLSANTRTTKDAVIVSRFIFKIFPDIRDLTLPGPTNPWLEGLSAMLDAYRAIRGEYDFEYELVKSNIVF